MVQFPRCVVLLTTRWSRAGGEHLNGSIEIRSYSFNGKRIIDARLSVVVHNPLVGGGGHHRLIEEARELSRWPSWSRLSFQCFDLRWPPLSRTDNCKVRCHIQQSAPARPPRDASCFTDGSIDFRKVELANRKVFGVRADDVGGRGCAKGRRW